MWATETLVRHITLLVRAREHRYNEAASVDGQQYSLFSACRSLVKEHSDDAPDDVVPDRGAYLSLALLGDPGRPVAPRSLLPLRA